MQSLRIKQELRALFQKRAVRGEDKLEAQLPGLFQKAAKLRVQERLAHKVEIQKLRVARELPGEQRELLRRQKMRRTLRPGAEGTGEIADIGDLQIGLLEHSVPSSEHSRREKLPA